MFVLDNLYYWLFSDVLNLYLFTVSPYKRVSLTLMVTFPKVTICYIETDEHKRWCFCFGWYLELRTKQKKKMLKIVKVETLESRNIQWQFHYIFQKKKLSSRIKVQNTVSQELFRLIVVYIV